MKRKPRYEIAQGDAGWTVRFVASNGEEILRSSQVYANRADAVHAVELVTDSVVWTEGGHTSVYRGGAYQHVLEVRDVDERTPEPAPG